jgi:2-C-methyl-D-erythritol 2,4-cyclodiphosphate synthase
LRKLLRRLYTSFSFLFLGCSLAYDRTIPTERPNSNNALPRPKAKGLLVAAGRTTIAPMIRTGIGFDAHRLVRDRRLVLGGVAIRHELGLEGHSDADVLCHAVMDALLGAIADGDIGLHFPNTDARWKDARSIELLGIVGRRLDQRHARILNVDATVLAERPKLADHIGAMRGNMADALGIGVERVSVKATTVEQLGSIGREEGIAAMAVATVDEAVSP